MRVAAVLFAASFAATVAAADPGDLAEGLKSKDAKVRLKAAEALGELGKDAAPALRQLCDATLDPNQKVSAAALAAVGKVNPRLQKALSDVVIPPNVKTAGGSLPARGADEIAAMGADGKPASGVLLSLLKAEASKGAKASGPVVRAAAVALVKVGADDPDTVKTFGAIATAKEASSFSRNQAALYFVAMTKEKAERFEAAKAPLEAMIGDPDAKVAKYALDAVGPLGRTAAPLLPAIDRAKLSANPVVRTAAFTAAERIAGAKE